MTYRVLDTVVLERDLPDHGLRKGDLGAVVEVYEPDAIEVEFVTASGRTAGRQGAAPGYGESDSVDDEWYLRTLSSMRCA